MRTPNIEVEEKKSVRYAINRKIATTGTMHKIIYIYVGGINFTDVSVVADLQNFTGDFYCLRLASYFVRR